MDWPFRWPHIWCFTFNQPPSVEGQSGRTELSQGFLTKSFNHCLTAEISGLCSWDGNLHSMDQLALSALLLASLSALKKTLTLLEWAKRQWASRAPAELTIICHSLLWTLLILHLQSDTYLKFPDVKYVKIADLNLKSGVVWGQGVDFPKSTVKWEALFVYLKSG